jgi:hypothetical protein
LKPGRGIDCAEHSVGRELESQVLKRGVGVALPLRKNVLRFQGFVSIFSTGSRRSRWRKAVRGGA